MKSESWIHDQFGRRKIFYLKESKKYRIISASFREHRLAKNTSWNPFAPTEREKISYNKRSLHSNYATGEWKMNQNGKNRKSVAKAQLRSYNIQIEYNTKHITKIRIILAVSIQNHRVVRFKQAQFTHACISCLISVSTSVTIRCFHYQE